MSKRAQPDLKRHQELLEETEQILARNPTLSRDTVWHVLLLLDEPPVERLRRALRRGQRAHHFRMDLPTYEEALRVRQDREIR